MQQNIPPQIKYSKEGYEKLKNKLSELEKKREEVIKSLQSAREQGDLSENGAYKAAKFELGNVDRQLRLVKYQIRYGKVVEKNHNNKIDFGSTVTLDDHGKELNFTLVGAYESNPSENKISINSPIGKAVLGRNQGDLISVNTPLGTRMFKIINIK